MADCLIEWYAAPRETPSSLFQRISGGERPVFRWHQFKWVFGTRKAAFVSRYQASPRIFGQMNFRGFRDSRDHAHHARNKCTAQLARLLSHRHLLLQRSKHPNMSLKAVVGQRKLKFFPHIICVIELTLNLGYPVCCLGLMQDVIRKVCKPNEWKASIVCTIFTHECDVYIRFVTSWSMSKYS